MALSPNPHRHTQSSKNSKKERTQQNSQLHVHAVPTASLPQLVTSHLQTQSCICSTDCCMWETGQQAKNKQTNKQTNKKTLKDQVVGSKCLLSSPFLPPPCFFLLPSSSSLLLPPSCFFLPASFFDPCLILTKPVSTVPVTTR